MNEYKLALKRFAEFSGRSRRREYWMFVLFNILFSIAAVAIDSMMSGGTMQGGGIVSGLYSLAVLVPSLAVAVRRLHDVGKSGWFLLIVLIPLIGAIWLLVLLATDGQPGTNKWGANPKEMAPAA